MADNSAKRTPHQIFDATRPIEPKDWTNVDEIYAGLSVMIEALPQKAMIPDDVADRWLRGTFWREARDAANERCRYLKHRGFTDEMVEEARKPAADDFRAAFRQTSWHIRRASGIGGSELGDIICGFKGERPKGFGSATNSVRSKLLLDTPFGGMDQLKRGHRMEERILEDYHERTGAVRDVESLNKLRGFRSDRIPYLIGTPDDIVLRPYLVDGKEEMRRIIPDSKAPSQKEVQKYQDESKGVPYTYQAQLHGYGLISYLAGISFHGYELVPFDYNKGDIDIIPVPHDKQMISDIIAATRWAWEECVMKGVVPEPFSVPDLEIEPEEKGILKAMIYDRQVAKSLADAAAESMKSLDSQLRSFVGQRRGKFSPDEGFAVFEAKVTYDEAKLMDLAKGQDGFDLDRFRSPDKTADAEVVSGILRDLAASDNMQQARERIALLNDDKRFANDKWDTSGIARALTEIGIDVTPAEIWSYSTQGTRKKSGPEFEALGRFKSKAGDVIDDVSRWLREEDNQAEILTGQKPEISPDEEYGAEPQ